TPIIPRDLVGRRSAAHDEEAGNGIAVGGASNRTGRAGGGPYWREQVVRRSGSGGAGSAPERARLRRGRDGECPPDRELARAAAGHRTGRATTIASRLDAAQPDRAARASGLLAGRGGSQRVGSAGGSGR